MKEIQYASAHIRAHRKAVVNTDRIEDIDIMKRFRYYCFILICVITSLVLASCLDNGELVNIPDEVLSTEPSDTNAPPVQWYRILGRGQFAEGKSVDQTDDGGYIICGTGDFNAFLVKTDSIGNKLWEKRFTAPLNAFGESAIQTSDGGYILCGSYSAGNNRGDRYLWLIKIDENGNTSWEKKFSDERYAWGFAVQEITNEGYIVCGDRDHHMALIKTDFEGNVIFDKTFTYYYSEARAVKYTSDGGYILCGNYSQLIDNTFQRNKMLMVKTDHEGNELWHKIFGGENYGYGRSVLQTKDGGYILGGAGNPDNKNIEGIWLIRTNENGNELWNNLSYYGQGTDAAITSDGGCIVCGYTIDRSIQAWLIKVDSVGKRQWDIKFKGDDATSTYSVRQTSDGGYIACGRINSPEEDKYDILLLKIAPEK